ncbi:MAG TPA: MFS transporter [Chloroflexota bacterium]|nr:MFS transporter [Chloroflexota bacterium]
MASERGEFLKLWTGQTISKLGSGIGGSALDLTAVLTLGASPGQMGLLHALRAGPVVLVGLFAGVLVDRVRRRPVMIGADLGRAALLALIPLAALLGWLRLELLFVVAPLVGVLSVLFDVAYQSFVPVLVRPERLMSANSRLATSDAFAEVTTPGLAGLLVQLISAPVTLLIDAVSFVVSALSIGLIRAEEPAAQLAGADSPTAGVWRELREGLHIVWRSPVLRALAGFKATREFFGSFYAVLYALYALRDLEIGPVLLGVAIGVGGASNLLGTLLVERVTRRFGVGPTIMGSQLLGTLTAFLTPLAGFTAGTDSPLVPFVLLAAGQASDLIHPLYDVNTLTLRQSSAPPLALGRVNASMQVLDGALTPLGALVAGLLATAIGAQGTLFIAGAGFVASRLWLTLSPVPRLR